MKEIKFRAWDKSEQQMVNWPGLINDPDNWWYELMSGQNPEDALMQYTGFIDYTGRQIYEGDIVRIVHTMSPAYAGKFIEGQPAELVEWCDGYYNIFDKEMGSNPNSCLVIGNIYETPELLKN